MGLNPLIGVVMLCLYAGPAKTTESDAFMAGAIPVTEPDSRYPVMYTSTLPIIYKFQLPQWNAQSMKIQFWSEHNNCTKSDNYEDGYPCPVMYHMNYLIDYFVSNMTSWRNLYLRKNREQGNDFLEDPTILWDKDVCAKLLIEPHFKSFQTSSKLIEKYIEILLQCTHGVAQSPEIINMTDVSTSLENSYHYTFTSFTSDYWSMLRKGGEQEAVAVSMWTALETTLMLHQYMETQKWTEAVKSCENRQIPWSLINAESFKQLLSQKRHTLDEFHELAIPDENTVKYFKLPLADCIFGDDDTFIVRILIPLIPKEASPINFFVKFHPFPFQAEGKVCSLWGGKDSIPFNLGLNGIIPCSCAKSDILCKGWIAEQNCSVHFLQEACIHAIHSDLEQDIVDHCPMQCQNAGTKPQQEVVIVRNDTHTIKVLSAPVTESNSTIISCPDGQMAVQFKNVGAYKITIPANCSILSEISPGLAVKVLDQVQVKHLMPYHWRNGISLSVNDASSSPESPQSLNNYDSKIQAIEQKFQEFDNYSSTSGSDVFLWMLVLALLIANIGLFVVVADLYKWKKEELYKANRLVYSVPSVNSNVDDFPIHDEQTSPLYANSL